MTFLLGSERSMPMSPMFLLLLVRILRDPHHTLEGLVGWLGEHNFEAHLCSSDRDNCFVVTGLVLIVLQCVGVSGSFWAD